MSDDPTKARSLFPARHSSLVTRHLLISRVTHSAEETVKFGRELAKEVQPPCTVLLEGELGSGKTTLVKGILASLASVPEDEVTSPTFTLVHEYGPEGRVYHVDLYRIEGARDLATLGLDDLLNREATVLIEWGEKFGEDVPRPCVRVRFEHLGRDARRITVERLD
ncbi:MAG: tRNA (adenosine(37)-N6)-threonylcarbamoyltransferase complex ATPase subunit type 1 TsaE [Terriglobia bacterium]|jgi:tRNA threonylcarbamoyladenosine biosynthesis protein TsaE